MIFIHVDGEAQGPFTKEELAELWEAGEVPHHSFFWYRGMRTWRPVSEFAPPDVSARPPVDAIRLTTAPTIAGAEIERELEIITAECVVGVNAFREIMASFTDTFGGRSQAMQESLRKSRVTCLAELRREAYVVGADAVVGVDLDYSEISGQGKSMLFLVASGTAVRLAVKPPRFRVS